MAETRTSGGVTQRHVCRREQQGELIHAIRGEALDGQRHQCGASERRRAVVGDGEHVDGEAANERHGGAGRVHRNSTLEVDDLSVHFERRGQRGHGSDQGWSVD